MYNALRAAILLVCVMFIGSSCAPSHCECSQTLEAALKTIQTQNLDRASEGDQVSWSSKVQRCVVAYEGTQKNEHTGVATIQKDPDWFTSRIPSAFQKAINACDSLE